MARPPELNVELIRMRAEQDNEQSPNGLERFRSPTTEEIIVRTDEVDRVDEAPADRPQRPILRREGSAPPPPPRQPPPPAPPAQEDSQATDSLSLAQLRNIVTNLPKLEPKAYAYSYNETRSLAEELEEWFQYTEQDASLLAACRKAFEQEFHAFDLGAEDYQDTKNWLSLPAEGRGTFVTHLVDKCSKGEPKDRTVGLQSIAYISMGSWAELEDRTEEPSLEEARDFEPPNDKYRKAFAQLEVIQESAKLLCDAGAVEVVYSMMRDTCNEAFEVHQVLLPKSDEESSDEASRQLQLAAAMTSLYFLVESGRRISDQDQQDSIRDTVTKLSPHPLEYLSQLLAKLRWEDSPTIPFTRILLLLWKSTLLLFGASGEREKSKKLLRKDENLDKDKNETFLVASPLDYHTFRQEITSKYPAYNPPPPLVPLEINNNTMLPLVSPAMSSHASQEDLQALGMANGASKSIFHQPTHIATPAPSPPPSPGGPGGKGGKKQNYQTNQNFPFLYPPLDSSSNDVGGKGNAELQDRLVGKRWHGSDVPASILEAAQLFHSRMRMSRALRQLWDVREEFIKYDRGWTEDNKRYSKHEKEESHIELYGLKKNSEDFIDTKNGEEKSDQNRLIPNTETADATVQRRLDSIEKFYRATFIDLQSIVIVLLKVLLSNITVLGNQHPPENGENPVEVPELTNGVDQMPKTNLNLSLCLSGLMDGSEPSSDTHSLESLNSIRTREITSKAISGYILSLLKWFRLSHILKFEYFAQLLLDSNFLPLALKYFALQDVDKAVDLKHNRDDLEYIYIESMMFIANCKSFFRFCYLDAGHQPTPPPETPERVNTPSSSEDEAQPPPISRNRPSPPAASPPSPGSPARRPEVDELGYPTTAIPSEPLTSYAPRFFLTHITILRILQKLTKNHAHRALLLVQYKSSTILRKNLKIPQPELRLYTLKLFKSQVPYCGRKWRQANMRVITAIYVFCRMGLRDEWISGTGLVDEWVDSAMAIERAWRGLVGWWHSRNYRESMGPESALEADNDFFSRELEKMGWGVGGLIDDDGEEEVEGEPLDWDGQVPVEGWA